MTQAECIDFFKSKTHTRLLFRVHGTHDDLPDDSRGKPFFVLVYRNEDDDEMANEVRALFENKPRMRPKAMRFFDSVGEAVRDSIDNEGIYCP